MTNEKKAKELEMEAEEQFVEGELDDDEAEAAAGGMVTFGPGGGGTKGILGGRMVGTSGPSGQILGGGMVSTSTTLKKDSIVKKM